MFEIKAVLISGGKGVPMPTFARLQIEGFQPVEGNDMAGRISSDLATEREIDDAVADIIQKAKKAGEVAKKILLKNR